MGGDARGVVLLGVLAANEAGAGGAAGAKSSTAAAKPAAATAPSSSSPAAPAQPAATPNAPTGNAVLSIAGKFELPAGAPNPIVGHTFVLLRDNYETMLAKGGFQIPAGMTPAKATALACANKAPD
jgi:hypothetical protein